MANRMDAYADWLVSNQGKKGTPEFETVANAYKSMRRETDPEAPRKIPVSLLRSCRASTDHWKT